MYSLSERIKGINSGINASDVEPPVSGPNKKALQNKAFKWWAILGSNQGPHAYQRAGSLSRAAKDTQNKDLSSFRSGIKSGLVG